MEKQIQTIGSIASQLPLVMSNIKQWNQEWPIRQAELKAALIAINQQLQMQAQETACLRAEQQRWNQRRIELVGLLQQLNAQLTRIHHVLGRVEQLLSLNT